MQGSVDTLCVLIRTYSHMSLVAADTLEAEIILAARYYLEGCEVSPFQAQVVELLLQGRDVFLSAPPGSYYVFRERSYHT